MTKPERPLAVRPRGQQWRHLLAQEAASAHEFTAEAENQRGDPLIRQHGADAKIDR
jgi:hypothetical protein